MREFKVELDGETISLSLSWKTMKEIKAKVADPAVLATEAMKEAQALENGLQYTPKVEFDTDDCVQMLSIASGMDEDDVGELVMRHGVFQSQEQVGRYIAALLGADEGEAVKKKTGKKSQKTS